MRKSVYSDPEPFSLSPLLSLLPVRGKVNRLPAFSTSLYARYENVKALLKNGESKTDLASYRKHAAEEAMLRQVLDWVALRSEAGI